MKNFQGVYKKGKLNHLSVSVAGFHRDRVKGAIEKLPYVDDCELSTSKATRIEVYLSDLATEEDLTDLERACREIVGEELDEE